MGDREIYHSAQLLIEKYGAAAPVQAALTAYTMEEQGDDESATVWKKITTAIFVIRSRSSMTQH